jgi:AAA+ superfamily predicted ATPase
MTIETDLTAENTAAFLTRIRLRARRRVLWMRFLWSTDPHGANQGLAITHAEVDRILADQSRMAQQELAFYASDPGAIEFDKEIREADERIYEEPEWQWLRDQFGLSGHELDLLSLMLASEADPSLKRVYGYLHDDANLSCATPWLAAAIFQWPPEASIGPRSALVEWRIATPMQGVPQPWATTSPWVADPYIALWTLNRERLDPALGPAVRIVSAEESTRKPCLYPEQLSVIREFADRRFSIALVGPNGSGRETLAAQFAASMGVDLISTDAGILLGLDVPFTVAVDKAIQAARMAKLTGAVLHWRNANQANPKVWQAASGCSWITLFSSTVPLSGPQLPAEISITLPLLNRQTRTALWEQITGQPAPAVIGEWVLTPAEISQAASAVPLGPEAIAEACRRNLRAGLGDLFTPLPCPYTWGDIVLPVAVREHLEELERQVRLRWDVYEEWGFERLVPLGRGITAMFSGPSGTGKTMAAQVLARSLGIELYRVDLAGVVNKYIGETEKRLKQVFDACERANVLLFFDEADALFGQRTQVKDAHDRFANIEIDYLLQRMEQFDGVAVLATNRKGDMDKAFLRRIRFIVDFVQPGYAERLALWRRVLAERSPAGEELLDRIDWRFLAEKLNMTGADITSAALGAAFLARAEGGRIGMNHVLHATRREMTKHGVVLRDYA